MFPTANDDNNAEFSDELKLTLPLKFKYVIVMNDFNAIFASGWKTDWGYGTSE